MTRFLASVLVAGAAFLTIGTVPAQAAYPCNSVVLHGCLPMHQR